MSRAFGKRVRDARRALGMRQMDFARVVGISAAGLCKIEGGRTDPRKMKWFTVIEIRRALGCTEEYLIGDIVRDER